LRFENLKSKSMSAKIKFAKANSNDFYSTVNKRVDEYFTTNKLSKNANPLMIFKTFFYPSIFIAAYLLLILNANPLWVQFLLWIVIGFFTAFIGINISHDAIHGSLSRSKKMNKFVGYSFNIIGANAYMWALCTILFIILIPILRATTRILPLFHF
jgi:linoleoyl-CoA desaturase